MTWTGVPKEPRRHPERPRPTGTGLEERRFGVILKRYYLGCLSHASYLIGDERTDAAVVVDPQRDVDQYLEDARDMGLDIDHVFLTHFHADFVAGHLELQAVTGAEIRLGARSDAEFAFRPMGDGDELNLGSVRLKVLETPGHTPESISILVYDLGRSADRPRAVLTGDTLFVGDVGRPDLMASAGVSAEELAEALYDSLHQKLLTLPDDTLVYPAHGAGSMCGRSLSSETVSTIGEQRVMNHALAPMSREEFVRTVTADQPEAPPYFSHDAMMNRRRREILGETLARGMKPLRVERGLELARAGAQVLDVRHPADFAPRHLAGSVNIGLRGSYATWAGTVLDRHRPIVILGEAGREYEAAMRLGRIGFDQVAGYIEGGIDATGGHSHLIRSSERIPPASLARRLASGDGPVILDVRGTSERNDGRIAGSVHIPLAQLRGRLREIPRGRPLVVHCAAGYRSSIAASLLRNAGFTPVADVIGGMRAWEEAGLPVETAVPAPAGA
jgi:hydroxyacylglutathione hydrolase